jgi:hypothetical protein
LFKQANNWRNNYNNGNKFINNEVCISTGWTWKNLWPDALIVIGKEKIIARGETSCRALNLWSLFIQSELIHGIGYWLSSIEARKFWNGKKNQTTYYKLSQNTGRDPEAWVSQNVCTKMLTGLGSGNRRLVS